LSTVAAVGAMHCKHLPTRLFILLDSGMIQPEPSKKAPAGKFWKVLSTRICYNTILVILVHSGWYLSMGFLHVEKTLAYSK
jgi:hypothetical protein